MTTQETDSSAPTSWKFFDWLVGGTAKVHKKLVEERTQKEFDFGTKRLHAEVQLEGARKQIGLEDAANALQEALRKVDAAKGDERIKLLEEGLGAFTRAQQARGKRTEELKTSALPALKTFNEIQSILSRQKLPQEKANEFRQRSAKALEALYAPKPDIGATTQLLGDLKNAVNSWVVGCQRDIQRCTEKLESIKHDLAPLAEKSPRDVAPLLGAVKRTETLLANGEIEFALEEVASLELIAREHLAAAEHAAESWEKLKIEVAPLLERANTLAAAKCPVLTTAPPLAATAIDMLEKLQAIKVGDEISNAAAVDLVNQAKAQIEQNELRLKGYQLLEGDRVRENELVEVAVATFNETSRKKLEDIDGWCRRTGNPVMDVLEPFESEKNKLVAEWATIQASATTVEALDASALVAKIEAQTQLLGGISIGSSDTLQAISLDKRKSAMPPFLQAQRTCEEKLAHLEPLGVPAYAELQKRLATSIEHVSSAGPSGYETTTKERELLVALALEIDEAILKAGEDSDKARKAAEKELQGATMQLDNFRKTMGRMEESWLTKAPEYKGYIELLQNDHDALLAVLTGTSDTDILTGLLKPIEALKTRITQASDAYQGKEPKTGLSLKNLTDRIGTEATRLEVEPLTVYQPSVHKRLADELNAIKDNLGKVPMDQSQAALVTWRQALTAALKTGIAARTGFEEFEKTLVATEGELDLLAKAAFKESDAYVASLRKRLDQLRISGKAEGGLAAARQQLEFLKAEMENAGKNPDVLTNQNDAARKMEDDAIAAAKRWELEYAAFKDKTLGQLTSAGVSGAAIKDVAELGKQADVNFNKTKDYTAARELLNSAVARAKVALALPEGIETLRKTLIPEALAEWRTAVGLLRKGFEEIVKAVSEREADAEAPVQKALEQVQLQFNPAIFNRACNDFAALGAPEAARRAARETALQEVRRLHGILGGDPRVGALARNPFVTPFVALRQVNVALNKIEKTLMTGF